MAESPQLSTDGDEPQAPLAQASSDRGDGPSTALAPQPGRAARKKATRKDFPIVGLGASAGGLEALEQFFKNMPADSGIAFVVIVHLAPQRESMMSHLLQKYTSMHVLEVKDGVTIQPNCVYIIPPDKDMEMVQGSLQLLEASSQRISRAPIDFFFRSLAEDQGERATSIILSGTGSNGSLGLRAIKEVGGTVMVQEPLSAKYDGMPRSAIATGLVDYILPPAEMPACLIEYFRDFRVKVIRKPDLQPIEGEDVLQKLFILLRNRTGHDFAHYKRNTIQRRIRRRMIINEIDTLRDYVRYLSQNLLEANMLFKELLIGVTNFFRDPPAFELLKTKVIPDLLQNKALDQPLRVWVTGCSTGEEAYSIAILLKEYMQDHQQNFKVQIFATDIDYDAVETARRGVYPDGIVVDVSEERLQRFFSQENDTYQINRDIREMVIFSVQSLIKDPPFSKLDLLSCRNLLIYLDVELQQKIAPLFHYSLNSGGILFLGTSETVSEIGDHFTIFDKKWKFFRCVERDYTQRGILDFPRFPLVNLVETPTTLVKRSIKRSNLGEHVEKILLENYAPSCVIIQPNGDIIYFHGRTGQYLEPASGEAQLNILAMAREGLKLGLGTAIRRATNQREPITYEGLRVKTNGGFSLVNLTVRPIFGFESAQNLLMVVFEAITPDVTTEPAPPTASPVVSPDEYVMRLEQELKSIKEYLQTTIEELETSNEELRSINEELQSANEELQSTNEELETSKEELQSVNEELMLVNTEFQNKIEEVTQINTDMNNMLVSTEIATLFLDNDLHIQRFTPLMARLINLLSTDVGRPVTHLVSRLIYENFIEDVQEVLDTLVPREREVQSQGGDWYQMRLLPYRTRNNAIDGVVITFMDISAQKQVEAQLRQLNQELREAHDYAESIIATIREPLLVLDAGLHVVSANRSFYQTFRVSPQETEGQFIYDLANGQWDTASLRELLQQITPQNDTFEDFRLEHDFPHLGRRIMLLNARRLRRAAGQRELILLAIEDITERRTQAQEPK